MSTESFQRWNTRIVTTLCNSAKGDLMLDRHGNLTTRNIWGANDKELPFNQHTSGQTLALIGREGWFLTIDGAQYILENCPPENRSDIRKLTVIADARKVP